MDQRFKQRLVGAVVLVALAIIFVPMLLSGPVQQTRVDIELDMPAAPERQAVPDLPDPDLLETPEPGADLADEPVPSNEAEVPDAGTVPEPAAEAAPEDDESVADSSAGSEPGTAGFFVQVGAFGSAENAERLADQLRADGFEMRVVEDDQTGQISHRVQAGPYGGRDEAERQAQTLADQHALPGFIIEP